MMAKEFSEKSAKFLEGGHSNHMFGPQSAGPEKPGTTAHDVSGGAPGPTFAKGGSGKMFGYVGSQPAQAGKTSAR